MILYRKSNRECLTIGDDSCLGVGGEARIFTVPNHPSLVAKVYHHSTAAHRRKLEAMLANPPSDPTLAIGHLSIAWPTDLLLESETSSACAGFLMARVTEMVPIIDFFHPRTRRLKSPLFNYFYLHRTARNLAACFLALHEKGYVIGDVNESNILVRETAMVTLVDTDSFQIPDADGGVLHRCPVGKPDYTPHEMHGRPFEQEDRRPEQDRFGLAVLIFQLLMEGTHPFAGIYQGRGEAPPIVDRIALGDFPFADKWFARYTPPPAAPRFDILHPLLRDLFLRCFCDGHKDPSKRPTAADWRQALGRAENELAKCAVNPQHRYGNHLSHCPWCERIQRLGGLDAFPSIEAVEQGAHLKSLQPQRGALASAATKAGKAGASHFQYSVGQLKTVSGRAWASATAPPALRGKIGGETWKKLVVFGLAGSWGLKWLLGSHFAGACLGMAAVLFGGVAARAAGRTRKKRVLAQPVLWLGVLSVALQICLGIAAKPFSLPSLRQLLAADGKIDTRSRSERQALENIYASDIRQIENPGPALPEPPTPAPSQNTNLFVAGDFLNLHSLAGKLARRTDPISGYLWDRISDVSRKALNGPTGTSDPRLTQKQLADDFNEIIQGESIYDAARFSNSVQRLETQQLLGSNPKGENLVRLNRLLVESGYPTELRQTTPPPPPPSYSSLRLTNSLGMRFVPILVSNEVLYVSIWETRMQDFDLFASESGQFDPKLDHSKSNHPAFNVSWSNAVGFCEWLTDRERKAGLLREGESYRLPSRHEWDTAASVSGGPYPWGLQRIPPVDSENVCKTRGATMPVGSCVANEIGCFDMGGNVREWVDDILPDRPKLHSFCGGSHRSTYRGVPQLFLDRDRIPWTTDRLAEDLGFRVALVRAAARSLAKLFVDGALVPSPPEINRRWTNSLGMRFVPLTSSGILMAIWETRVGDYAPFASATSRAMVRDKNLANPVRDISWVDAVDFCSWLTKKEQAEGRLTPDQQYRLPTDLEWSHAVGMGAEEGNSPSERHEHRDQHGYPWRDQRWTGPRHDFGKYDDAGWPAVVGSYPPNDFGIYDLSGNVWEWCLDDFTATNGRLNSVTTNILGALRGGAMTATQAQLQDSVLSGFRKREAKTVRQRDNGFRVVVELQPAR